VEKREISYLYWEWKPNSSVVRCSRIDVSILFTFKENIVWRAMFGSAREELRK
jgi:hypothetical protein